MRYSSTLLLALHCIAVAQSTPVSSETPRSVPLGNHCPSVTALDLQSLHYHKRNLVHFLSGGSKRDKERRRKDKDAGESSTRPLLADEDKAVDSSQGGSSLTDAVRAKWTRGSDEPALQFWDRLLKQAAEYKAAGKLDEMGEKRIYGLGKAIVENESGKSQRAQDPYDLHGDILKVIDGTWGKAEEKKHGRLKLFKRSANAKSSKLSQLMRPLLNDPDVWAKDKENFQQYWKHGKNEDMEQFRNRLRNQAETCLRHKVFDEVTTRTIKNSAEAIYRLSRRPGTDALWQRELDSLRSLATEHAQHENYETTDDTQPRRDAIAQGFAKI